MYFRLILIVQELIGCLLEMEEKMPKFSSRLLSPSGTGQRNRNTNLQSGQTIPGIVFHIQSCVILNANAQC